MPEQRHSENAGESGSSQNYRCAPCNPTASATGQHHRTHREAFRNLMQEDCEENQPAQPVRNQKPRRDGDAVEESVDDEAEEDGISLVRVDELILVRLFAEVEVGRDRMFEKVNDEVTKQNQEGRAASAQFEALRNHLYQRRGQHESCTEGDEVSQVAPLPVALHNNRSPENVSRGGGQAEQDADEDRVHWVAG